MAPRLIDNTRVNRAIDFLEHSLGSHADIEDISLGDIADAACFSKYHFVRLFRESVGETPVAFLKRVRLERAARKLIYISEKSVSEIACESGFASSQSFSTAFKNKFGMSPRSYRRSNTFRLEKYWSKFDDRETDASHAILKANELISYSDIRIEQRPPCKVAYLRFYGVDPEADGESKRFQVLKNWARHQGLLTRDSDIISVGWDNPSVTPSKWYRLDACLPITESIKGNAFVGIQTIPGGTYAVMPATDGNADVRNAWEVFLRYFLPTTRYVPTFGARFEIHAPSSDGQRHSCLTHYMPVQQV